MMECDGATTSHYTVSCDYIVKHQDKMGVGVMNQLSWWNTMLILGLL